MLPELMQSIEEAKALLRQIDGRAYDHTESVAAFALELVNAYPEVDSDLITVSVWWHDTGRLYSENHEGRSATMARQSLLSLGVKPGDARVVYDAIVYHKWSMSPKTLEGEIVRDADKLDWVRPSRWVSWGEEGRVKQIRRQAETLDWIRNEVLHLEPSRPIFDRCIAEIAAMLVSGEAFFLEHDALAHVSRAVFDYRSSHEQS
jgi:HD superfamily phosphohydrolase YqeK